jgi:hypothetical protein
MANQFVLHIYIAAPGTPYLKPNKPPTVSNVGHMWYGIQQVGGDIASYGFAPIEDGDPHGPGEIKNTDTRYYQNPHYIRSMEVTKAHFDALRSFGESPSTHFSLYYNGGYNSCIDFTWAALRHAKISHHSFQGTVKPVANITYVKAISDVVKNSAFNNERNNRLPKQSPLQKLITQNVTTGNMRAA